MNECSKLLEKLQRSEVFADDFPQRPQITHAQMARLTEEERRIAARAASQAIELSPNWKALVDIVHRLRQVKYEDAVPTLAGIWRNCALIPLRTAVGHALRDIGSKDARAALIDLIEDSDRFSAYMGIRAIFDTSPSRAYDTLVPYFDAGRVRQPGGVTIPGETFGILAPNSFTNTGPEWTERRAPQWLREDLRWIALCVKLRHDDFLGASARNVLRYVDPQLFHTALAAAEQQECRRNVLPRIQACGDLVRRYRSGQYIAVWQELRSFGEIDGDLREEAEAVAVETMKRVAGNLDLLASRLEHRGWRALMGQLRTKPDPEDGRIFLEIERITKGPIPPSMLAFWKIVGGVDLVWNYRDADKPPDILPGIELDVADPLCVDPPGNVDWVFEEWQDAIESTHPELLDPFMLPLAPDYLHKADISGGAPYGIDLPFLGADPVFQNEEHSFHFVDYLRHCMHWGGFSRLARNGKDDSVVSLIKILTDGFEPF